MADSLSVYLNELRKSLAAGIATEHTYRPALKTLVQSLATGLTAYNDPKRVECGAPDFTVALDTKHGPLTLGYIEAKDIDTDLGSIERDAARKNPTTINGQQLKKYLTLPNLILTDYLEFRWYVDGQPRAPAARLGRVIKPGKLQKETEGGQAVAELIRAFLDHEPPAIVKPRDLALRMARLTHRIRDMIVTAFETGHASDMLRDLHRAFEETLIPELSIPNFADMYAQTLAYGLFAARVNHGGREPFRRLGAAAEIPKTNPFLRKLFAAITGPDLSDEPFVGFVDDLAQLLADTDMAAVLAEFGKRTRREDPIVHFYETFLAAYDPKLRKSRGVYYTPEPVVSYIVRSVDYLLRTRFGCGNGLADTGTVTYKRVDAEGKERTETVPRVVMLDPACGTGTFLYAVVDLVREQFMRGGNAGRWSLYVRENLLKRLFGFELLMAPYAVAHLKLGMELAGQDLPEAQRQEWGCELSGEDRLGIYLTNTLEEALRKSELLMGSWISDEANAAAEIKRELPIMVVLGNPPYAGHSVNASWREVSDPKTGRMHREPTWIGRLIRDYYFVDGQPLDEKNPKWLQDDYVKFIRFGQWRIGRTGAGILAFITNHSYLDNPTFRGMRQNLMHAFTDIYVLDLHGSAKRKEICPDGSPDENVFDIQQGVAIALFVNEPGKSTPAKVHHADLWGQREGKYATLSEADITNVHWTQLSPNSPFYLFKPQLSDVRVEYEEGWRIPDAMPVNVLGFQTHRDSFAIDFHAAPLKARIQDMLSPTLTDDQLRTRYGLRDKGGSKLADARAFLRAADAWEDALIDCLYRPFDWRPCYFSQAAMDRPRREIAEHVAGRHNLSLLVPRQLSTQTWRHVIATREVAESCVVSTNTREQNYVFPLYVFPPSVGPATRQDNFLDRSPWPPSKDGRRPNLELSFVQEMAARLGLLFVSDGEGDLQRTFGPEDVFHYIYAVLHSPTFRTRYADFLKIDFPRVPLTSNLDLFRALAVKGRALASLHLFESLALASPITHYPVPGPNVVDPGFPRYLAVGEPTPEDGKPLEAGRVYINRIVPMRSVSGQYFEGVPRDVWEFWIGGYQPSQKWLKDRRGRTLSSQDIEHYEKIVVALQRTIRLMGEIDRAIPSWPLP